MGKGRDIELNELFREGHGARVETNASGQAQSQGLLALASVRPSRVKTVPSMTELTDPASLDIVTVFCSPQVARIAEAAAESRR